MVDRPVHSDVLCRGVSCLLIRTVLGGEEGPGAAGRPAHRTHPPARQVRPRRLLHSRQALRPHIQVIIILSPPPLTSRYSLFLHQLFLNLFEILGGIVQRDTDVESFPPATFPFGTDFRFISAALFIPVSDI